MSSNSNIEWTDASWNPVLGCSKVSEGCRGCYAILQAWMKQSNPSATVRAAYEGLVEKRSDGSLNWTGRVNCIPERLEIPLRWKTPKRIFVNSLSDLFHPEVPDEFIDRAFAVMALTPRHTYQILTKRPDRMATYVNGLRGQLERLIAASREHGHSLSFERGHLFDWPLRNVWLGTSVENQKAADERIPYLLATAAAVRFLSCEPLLGPVVLEQVIDGRYMYWLTGEYLDGDRCKKIMDGLSWVIAGGESGPKARPMHPDWARSLRDQCQAAGVPFFFKQFGEWAPTKVVPGGDLGGDLRRGHTQVLHAPGNPEGHFRQGDACVSRVGKHSAGRSLDGREWNEMPVVAGSAS